MMRRLLLIVLAAGWCGSAGSGVSAARRAERVRAGRRAAAREQLPAAPLLIAAYAFVWLAAMFYLWTIWRRLGKVEAEMRALEQRRSHSSAMTAGHFIFIPAVLLVGIVIGWISARAPRGMRSPPS